MPEYIELILAAITGYFLGSIPFGLILTRMAGLGDIRNIGSGNIGATNVLRTGRKMLAFWTLLLDGGKGALAFILGQIYAPELAFSAAFFAFLGHLFPVWLTFKGGKGVATFLGIMLAISWKVGLLALVIWVLIAFVFRFLSLASLSTALICPILCWILISFNAAIWTGAMVILVVLRHHGNIKRLLQGTESKIGQKSS